LQKHDAHNKNYTGKIQKTI